MSKIALACATACTIAALAGLLGFATFSPSPAAAATATTSVDSSLLDGPNPGAAPIATLPWGTAVSIDGDPVDGYYPVSTDGMTGWLPAEVLEIATDPPVETTDPSAAPAETVDPPPLEPAPADETAADAPAAGDPAAAPAEPAAAEPSADTTIDVSSYPDAGPTGPADVLTEAPVYGGPGPEYGLIATAPVGSSVEQTGHQVAGYVTVRFAEITGWAPLDHLGPPGSAPVATPEEPPSDRGDAPASRDEESKRKDKKGNDRRD